MIQQDLENAIKARDKVKMAALREIKTAVMNFKTSATYKGSCDDNDVVSIIQKLVKQHEDSARIYSEAGRLDLYDEEVGQMVVLKEYLPKMLSENELKEAIVSIISETGAETMKDMGKVMAKLKTDYPNQYDGRIASMYIKEKLS